MCLSTVAHVNVSETSNHESSLEDSVEVGSFSFVLASIFDSA